MKRLIALIYLPALLIWFSSCQQPQSPETTGSVVFDVVYPGTGLLPELKKETSARTTLATFNRMHCIVYQNTAIVWEADLTHQDSTFQAEISLEAGSGYKVELQAFINNALVLTGISSVFELTAGETKSVTIGMNIVPDLIAPSNLDATAINSTRIDLTWDDNSSNEAGFTIQSRLSSGGWVMLGQVNENITTYQHTGISPGEQQVYRVQAFGQGGVFYSAWSNIDSATTSAINHAPNPPANPSPQVAATYTDTINVTLTWSCTDPDSDPMTYKVRWGLTSALTDSGDGFDTTRFVMPNTIHGTHYYWNVTVNDGRGGFTTSPLWDFITQNHAPHPPGNPTPFNRAAGQDTISLNLGWNCSDPDGQSLTYVVEWGTSPDLGQTSGTLNSPTFTLPTLTADEHYFWRVTAKDTFNLATVGPDWEFYTKAESNVITFPDPNLLAKIRQIISKPTGPIFVSDVDTITSLSAPNLLIQNISGLEYMISLKHLLIHNNLISNIEPISWLTGLTELNLSFNNITDIWPLEGLWDLTILDLEGNDFSDIYPLQGMTSLEELYLTGNNISDLAPLSEMTQLSILALTYNQIVDIAPLDGLTSLTWLGLSNNQIVNIAPLVNNTGMATGDVVYLLNNPLSGTSINTYIPQLEARGVTVYH